MMINTEDYPKCYDQYTEYHVTRYNKALLGAWQVT